MDFAKKLLSKYGWKEGDGLGKNLDGMQEPLKASLKFDTSGLGVDKAAEFNNHWWERVFDEAAGNVKVGQDGEDVTMDVKDKRSVEISTKEYSVRKLKEKKKDSYGDFFLKQAVLTGEGNEEERTDKINVDDIAVSAYKPLTDEELFAACDGRTAHKGARHGLNLTGKLARIEQQEKELLAKMQSSKDSWTVVKSKKKKKKSKEAEVEEPAPKEAVEDALYTAEYVVKSKKKKKRKAELENDLSKCLESFEIEKSEKEPILAISEDSKAIKKAKKSKKKRKQEEEEHEMEVEEAVVEKKKKKKSKNKE